MYFKFNGDFYLITETKTNNGMNSLNCPIQKCDSCKTKVISYYKEQRKLKLTNNCLLSLGNFKKITKTEFVKLQLNKQLTKIDIVSFNFEIQSREDWLKIRNIKLTNYKKTKRS